MQSSILNHHMFLNSRFPKFWLALFVIFSIHFSGFSQTCIRTYLQSASKNYSIEAVPGTSYPNDEYVTAGTKFTGNQIFSQGAEIHFFRTDKTGTDLANKTYSDNNFIDERSVDVVPYTSTQSIIVAQVRGSGDGGDNIKVLVVNNSDGSIALDKILSNPGRNLYALHAIYQNNLLYICGYIGTGTNYPNYPDYTPSPGTSDKEIFVLSYDLNNTVSCLAIDFPFPNDPLYPSYDFDMAIRMVPLGTGNIFVTGSCNSDYVYEDWIQQQSTPSFGSATLSLLVDANLSVLALRPFLAPIPPVSSEQKDVYEYGFGAYEDPNGDGLYVFSNTFLPASPSYGFSAYPKHIGMTYISKTSLNFTPWLEQRRLHFPDISHNWGTQVLGSNNSSQRLILAGLQDNWDVLCSFPSAYLQPSQTNINPFLAELSPTWNSVSNTIGLNGIYFWKTYFTQYGTSYFNVLGGGISNIAWPTEFVSNKAANNTTDIVFMAPRSHNQLAFPTLGMKFTRTDINGDVATGNSTCDNSYEDCIPSSSQLWTSEIANGLFYPYSYIGSMAIISVTNGNSIAFTANFVDQWDCSSSSVYKPSTIDDMRGVEKSINIYPNPANEYLEVDLNLINNYATIEIELTDVTGRILRTLYKGPASNLVGNRIQVDAISPGLYIAKIKANGEIVHQQKLAIN